MILLGNCSMHRLVRLLSVRYLLQDPGQTLDRFPVSASPCSRAAVGEREPLSPAGSWILVKSWMPGTIKRFCRIYQPFGGTIHVI